MARLTDENNIDEILDLNFKRVYMAYTESQWEKAKAYIVVDDVVTLVEVE